MTVQNRRNPGRKEKLMFQKLIHENESRSVHRLNTGLLFFMETMGILSEMCYNGFRVMSTPVTAETYIQRYEQING